MKQKKVNVSARKRRLVIAPLVAIAILLSSCGVTKATISKPAEGTQTTITITTNNPISTEVSPNITLKDKEK